MPGSPRRTLLAALLVLSTVVFELAGLAGVFELAGFAGTPALAADRGDRLDRFRELAASRLGLVQILDTDDPAEAFREIYALLDDEIVESLASGGPFASVEFLQDRLDTFAEAWGGASLRLVRSHGLPYQWCSSQPCNRTSSTPAATNVAAMPTPYVNVA